MVRCTNKNHLSTNIMVLCTYKYHFFGAEHRNICSYRVAGIIVGAEHRDIY